MQLFDNLETDDDVREEKDSLGGGFGAVDSGIYDLKVKYAYITESAGGAAAMNLHLETEDGKILRDQQWMTSGKAKGQKNYYMVKEQGKETGERAYLPGFNAVNNLCLLTIGKDISKKDGAGVQIGAAASITEKTIPLYSYDDGGEVPTKVQMVMDLLGQKVTAGVLKQIVDKKKKDDATGEYEPTGETKEVNEVDKYFRQRDGMTVTEIKARATEAAFKDAWAAKYTGEIQDKSCGTATAGTAGTPAASGANAKKENLFS